MTSRLPALFLGHGSPMTVISDVPERRAWQMLGQALPRPKAILTISAHWESHGQTLLTGQAQPPTIHDFRGFPQELFDIQYPAPGNPALAARVIALLGADQARTDSDWGFDHGTWGILRPLYPNRDIPVVAMSLDRSLSAQQHLELGRRLAPLRDEGVLLVGSGNIIHNLMLWRQLAGRIEPWAGEFRQRINTALLEGDHATLTRLEAGDDAAAKAVNSGEHYLPLLYIAGAQLAGDKVGLFNDSLDGALSMTSVLIGDITPLGALAEQD